MTSEPNPRPTPDVVLSMVGVPQSVVDQVTDTILQSILSGSLVPGQPVAIRELSEQLGVSHVPVREALRRLEGRGLVIFRRGRRPQIAPIDPADLDALFHLRSVIEADVAARSAPLLKGERLAQVHELNQQFADHMRRRQLQQASAVHTQLHLALLAGASRWDRQVLEHIWAASERYLQVYLGAVGRDPDTVQMIIDTHASLVAVADHATPNALRAAVLDHIEFSRRQLRPAVEAASARATG